MDVFGKNLNNKNSVSNGNLLLAEPMLADTNFQRTVILVCQHNKEEGSFGLVINKVADVTIQELEGILPTDQNLYIGGPVQQNTLHFIHKFNDLEDAIHLGNGIYWGGNFDQVKSKGVMGLLSTENIRFFLGYSGWGENQLHEEIEHNSWVISTLSLSVIFEVPSDELWETVLKRMGGRFSMFTNFPINPNLN